MDSTATSPNTPASLLALHRQDPRKLDALAYETVMQQPVEWHGANKWMDGPGWYATQYDGESTQPFYNARPNDEEADKTEPIYLTSVECYSASLDAAALLEARLAERGINHIDILCGVVDASLYKLKFTTPTMRERSLEIIRLIACATAVQRTIAAILAAQGVK